MAGRHPKLAGYEVRALESDFAELTPQAEELVYQETGLRSEAGPARARVVDRTEWVAANVASFERLLRPVTEKLGQHLDRPRRWSPVPVGATRRVAGLEVGLLLG